MIATREALRRLKARDEQLLLVQQYDILMMNVREAVFWERMHRQQAAALCVQARIRGWLARIELERRTRARDELQRDALEYSQLIAAVRRAIKDKRDAEARRQQEAATCIQAVHRGLLSRVHTAQRRRLERPRALGLADLREWSIELRRAADLMPSDSWGFVHLGSSISRSELDEMQLEAARDHGLQAHELGVPITDAANSSIRPLLVFDSNAAAQATERVYPLELGSAAGRRCVLIRQEMMGLTIDRESRVVLSRPMHKLWALGEYSELRVAEEKWLLHSEQEITLLENPQGTIVHFWELNGRLHAATRGGLSPSAPRVEQYVAAQRVDYAGFAHCAISAGFTPVFAWWGASEGSRAPQVVDDATQLVLIALRCMRSGLYLPYPKLERTARRFNIPVVSRLASWSPKPGVSFDEAIADLRDIASRAGGDPLRRRMIPLDDDHALIVLQNGYLAKLATAQPVVHIASETSLPDLRLQMSTTSSSLPAEWHSLTLRREEPVEHAVGHGERFRGDASPHSALSAFASLQVEITLTMEGGLNDLQRIGGGYLCDTLADEMGITAERLELRSARLVRPGLLMSGEVKRELAPCVEVVFEVFSTMDVGAAEGTSPGLPAAVAAAVLLGSSRRRLGVRLGLPLLQLPAVRTELPPVLRSSRSTCSSPPRDQLYRPLVERGAELVRPWSSPEKALDPTELEDALRVVHRFVHDRMGMEVRSKPPSLSEVMASTTAQKQLLELLQSVLIAAERLPVDERPALVGSTSLLVLALQRHAHGFDASHDIPHRIVGPGEASNLSSIGNRVLGALAHAGRAVDDAAASLTDAMAGASSEARQRAWSGAARPELCRIRTFVRLRPPSTFELLWARRSKRIGWGARHADMRSTNSAQQRGAPSTRVELSEVFEPSASQQRVFSNVAQPLVAAVLRGLDCALLCVGAAGVGKTHTLFGSEAVRADPLGAQREEWGVAMRACEAFLQRAAPHTLAGPLAASGATATGAASVHMSFVEVDGEECCDLLRGGAPLSVEGDSTSGVPHAVGAAQVRVHSLDDAAYTLRLGLRASHRGVLAPRTHTILTLAVVHSDADAEDGSAGGAVPVGNKARLVLVDLASGDLHGPQRYRVSSSAPQTAASRSLAVLGACVAARAEGAQRGVPWGESKLSLLLREVLAGEFCTAVVGCCGAAEADTQGTISTLHFLLHAGRLNNRVRVSQPPLESVVRRLRSLDERLTLHQQTWLERRPPVAQTGSPISGRGALVPSIPAGGDDLGPQECGWFQELAAQVGLITQQREEQMAHLRTMTTDLRAIINEDAGRQRRSLPWHSTVAGLCGAHEVMQRLEQAEQLVRALGEWLYEAQEMHASLVHALKLQAHTSHGRY